ALGYEKLVLYGTSYGTKVAELYAARYPQNVEALVLDSVVPPEGPETFELTTFKAIPGVLNELCSKSACSGITSSPVHDIARLANQLHKHRLTGSVYDGSGHRHQASIDEQDLLGIMQAGDLNPALRALLPAAVTSAIRGEPDPLLRLNALSEGLIPNVPLPPRRNKAEQETSEEENNALFLATSCEEKRFPWQRQASAQTRMAEAQTALKALPTSDFYPFDATTALENSLIPYCLDWQDASPPPPPVGLLPNVPTLIFSGAQDLRTPTANARQIATQIPDAQLLVVPYTGHSVLGSDFSDCAQEAVDAFFSGTAVSPCKPSNNLFAPTPVTPTKLAYIKPIPGLSGKPGRTLMATLATMIDLTRQVIGATLQADQELPSGSSFGGLHGGYARLSGSAVDLHELTFVSGVQLSAHLPIHSGEIQPATITVGGSSAARGTVRLDNNGHVSGTLGGHRFNLDLAKVHIASVAPGSWPTHLTHFPLGPLAHIR
ncbi:MAG: alpha/beta fold hydrolase, partial [Solirubrobacteraceae bacterium]